MRKLFRFIYIQWTLLRYSIDDVILALPWLRPIRFLRWINPWTIFSNHKRTPGERLRLALIQLGPSFVKFGQMLSTRRDLLSDDLADELAKLRDQVPPFASKQAIEIIERELKNPISTYYSHIDSTPLASASIAQVHAATLISGEHVVIKVVRPGIAKTIRNDIALMQFLARTAERFCARIKRMRPTAIIQEFSYAIRNELDLSREAANANQLRRLFKDDHRLYIPKIYWDYCTSHIMVMERISGIPIAQLNQLDKHGINRSALAKSGLITLFTQIFYHRFFHADMHPGNLFVDPRDPESPTLIAVDFGIMGTLDHKDQHYIAENFLAFFKRDYHRVAQLHIESGWLPAGTRAEAFEAAIRAVSEPIFGKPLGEISFAKLFINLLRVAGEFHMIIQPQLVLLQKTLLNVEGLARDLDPHFNLWDTAKPFLEKWMREQRSPRTTLKRIIQQLPDWQAKFPDMPNLIYNALKQAQTPAPAIQKQTPPYRKGFFQGVSFTLCVSIIAALVSHWV